MNAWSNIITSQEDPEIIQINDLEKSLGELSNTIYEIRELITRFEICHFKYQAHLEKIKESIARLTPVVDTSNIGTNHIQHGEQVLSRDITGRSLTGQQYIWAIKEWLDGDLRVKRSEHDHKNLARRIRKWLGPKSPDKAQLLGLLLARLTWNWEAYEKLKQNGKFQDLEAQLSRIDICHYAFPENLNSVLKGIGQLKEVADNEFMGCGSFNDQIKVHLDREFLNLNKEIKTLHSDRNSKKDNKIRAWLLACLAKTIKENINISIPVVIVKS